MKVELQTVRGVLEHFTDGRTEAPREVLQALTALIGDPAAISHSVAVYKVDRGGEKIRASWECVALAGDALVSVSGSRAGGEWYIDSRDEDDPEQPIVFGSLIPLSEVAACRVLNVKSESVDEWLSEWQIDLKSRDALVIPWPAHNRGQERAEALAMEVAKRLR